MIQIFRDALVKSNLIFRCFSNIEFLDEGLEEENHFFFFMYGEVAARGGGGGYFLQGWPFFPRLTRILGC